MPKFPVVDNDGCFDHETVVLTKPLLGFYVQERPLDQVQAYTEGLWDVCSLLEQILANQKNKDLTVNQYREQIQQIINERYDLMTTMHDYINQSKAEKKAPVNTPR
ncbi:hypothetical protein ACO2Q8_09240 [Larkinella sp. VNQ87]|uniref:hypothetical protein n=1 Tax=Larkinella sp. VNQ87 TaxID=3400921 RepID=UPI003BFA7DE4